MSTIVQKIRPLVRSPQFIVLLCSLLLLVVNIAYIGRLRPFNSDDLYWQQVIRTWHPFGHQTLYLATKDIFVENVPFFIIMDHLFGPSRRLLIAESTVLTLSTFVLFYVSTLYFLRRLKVRLNYANLLPFVWLASFGFPLVENYLNSDWRTFEVGFCFVTYAITAAILSGDIHPFASRTTKSISGFALVFVGLLIYSDPYYVFFAIGPLLLASLALFGLQKITRRQLALVFGAAFISVIIAKVFALIAIKAHIIIVGDTPSLFVSFDNIITNIISSLHGLLIIFGADFFGQPAFASFTAGSFINAVLLSFILYHVYRLVRYTRISVLKNMSTAQLWGSFFGAMVAFVLVLYTLTTLVMVNNYRFFIVLVYCAISFMVIILAVIKNQRLRLALTVLLIIGTVFNMSVTLLTNNVRIRGNVAINVGNGGNTAVINAAEAQGLTKGYAGYWDSNVNSYLSKGRVTFLPSLCNNDGKTVKFKWLVDGGQFTIRAKRSFYLIDPDFVAPGVCTEKQLAKQFGKPAKTITIGDKTMLVYNYDISSRITLSLP